jgi:hypothetical protein
VFALPVERGFFPLDEELELLPGSLTPHLQECLVRLGAWIPSFEEAGKLLQAFTGVDVSEPTVRRRTEGAGAAYVALQEEEVERIERELPPVPPGPAKALLSVDGAMVPLLHGEWGEVKTLVIGEIQKPVQERGELVVHSEKLSYFSRMIDSDSFCRLALVETDRRGLENAGLVAAVSDGAEWEQKFIDFHREDALRILDFPHAGERISPFGAVVFGEGTPESKVWLEERLHALKHDGPAEVLAELRELQKGYAEVLVLAENLAYLEKREKHMQYPAYREEGLPIASGAVESGNKLVVEARLKGAGMHWERSHVNPMVALRNIVCSDRWDEEWPRIASRLRQDAAQSRRKRREERRAKAIPQAREELSVTVPAVVEEVVCQEQPVAAPSAQPVSTPLAGKKQPYRPGPDHPWRHSPIGRARYRPYYKPDPPAKN